MGFGDKGRRGDPHHPSRLGLAQAGDPGRHRAESVVQRSGQLLARPGQGNCSSRPPYQSHAQFHLQAPDCLGNCRMSDIQQSPGLSEAAAARRGIKGPQGRQRGQVAPAHDVSSAFVSLKFLSRSIAEFLAFPRYKPFRDESHARRQPRPPARHCRPSPRRPPEGPTRPPPGRTSGYPQGGTGRPREGHCGRDPGAGPQSRAPPRRGTLHLPLMTEGDGVMCCRPLPTTRRRSRSDAAPTPPRP